MTVSEEWKGYIKPARILGICIQKKAENQAFCYI